MDPQSSPFSDLKPYRVALVGYPNCGKSSLFNTLTGLYQKVANYPGATVENRSGPLKEADTTIMIDHPGTTCLSQSLPEAMDDLKTDLTNAYNGNLPDLFICVMDATRVQEQLPFVLQLKALDRPIILALNMADLVHRQKSQLCLERLAQTLCLPVVETIGIEARGADELRGLIVKAKREGLVSICPNFDKSLEDRVQEAASIADTAGLHVQAINTGATRADQILLHPILGFPIYLLCLFLVFQALFIAGDPATAFLSDMVLTAQAQIHADYKPGLLRSFFADGLLPGLGGVIIFLPQLILLFVAVVFMDLSGYTARAAALISRIMAPAGLDGRQFVPMMGSFGGFLEDRTEQTKGRINCAARLPICLFLISAFLTPQMGDGPLNEGGILLFLIYVMTLVVGFIGGQMQRLATGSPAFQPKLDLPNYQWPSLRMMALSVAARLGYFFNALKYNLIPCSVLVWLGLTLWGGDLTGMSADTSLTFGFGGLVMIPMAAGLIMREAALSSFAIIMSLALTANLITGAPALLLPDDISLASLFALLAWFALSPQIMQPYTQPFQGVDTPSVAAAASGAGSSPAPIGGQDAWRTLSFGLKIVFAYGVAVAIYQGASLALS